MKKNRVKESANEGPLVNRLAGDLTQSRLPNGQRALDANDRFQRDDGNRQQMREPEPRPANPFPMKERADQNGRLANENVADVSDVNNDNDVLEESVTH